MSLIRVAIAGLAIALSTEAKTVEQLTAEYMKMGNASCATVAKKVPQLPLANQAAFMSAYQAFSGTDPSKMIAAASKVLGDKDVAGFLSAEDSFGPGGFDAALVQCVVITDATPLALAQFAVNGSAQEASVAALLKDGVLMRDMLVGGAPQGNKYAEAASLYSEIKKASTILAAPRVRDAGLWDDRNQSSVLHRLALATALAFADPLHQRFNGKAVIDPVKRYLNFEKAYLAGDLDPYFEVLTVFELRFVAPFDGADDDLDWMRETLLNFRPDHIVGFEYDYHWRYARAVRTEVSYGDSKWPDGVATYRDYPAAGAVCGGRAFFGRFSRKAFGLPDIRFPQPGHGAMITWGPTGWMPLLGRPWEYGSTDDSLGSRSGPDFKLEADAREYRADFQRILRGSWAATIIADQPVSRHWTPETPSSYGTGGNWSALIYAAKVTTTQAKWTDRALAKSQVPTKVAALIAKWNVTEPKPSIAVGPDGSISIPAAATSFVNASASVVMMKHYENGSTLFSPAGDFLDPDSTAFEYNIESEEGGVFYLTLNFTTWHVNGDLQLSTNSTKAPIELPVYYTTGYWKETQPVQVTLVKGKNVLRFVRQLGHGLALKEVFLLKSKPVVPPAPGNYTPAPAPPSVDRYIKLHAGLTCESQGILDLDDTECGYAAAHFGFTYTGSRSRNNGALRQGCWGIVTGQYAGNANLIMNSNKSSPVTSDVAALCLRS